MRYPILSCTTCGVDTGPLSTHPARLRHLLELEAAGRLRYSSARAVAFAREHKGQGHDLDIEELETKEWIRRGRLEIYWV